MIQKLNEKKALSQLMKFLSKAYAVVIGWSLFTEDISLKDFSDRIKKFKSMLN